jgi:hypothetical protein
MHATGDLEDRRQGSKPALETEWIAGEAKDLAEFHFASTPINETLVRDLAGGVFLAQQHAVLIGVTGNDIWLFNPARSRISPPLSPSQSPRPVCNTACTGPLMRCNLPGQVGTCASAAASAPTLTPWGFADRVGDARRHRRHGAAASDAESLRASYPREQ